MRHGRGHTLIEMLISASIVSIMMLGNGIGHAHCRPSPVGRQQSR